MKSKRNLEAGAAAAGSQEIVDPQEAITQKMDAIPDLAGANEPPVDDKSGDIAVKRAEILSDLSRKADLHDPQSDLHKGTKAGELRNREMRLESQIGELSWYQSKFGAEGKRLRQALELTQQNLEKTTGMTATERKMARATEARLSISESIGPASSRRNRTLDGVDVPPLQTRAPMNKTERINKSRRIMQDALGTSAQRSKAKEAQRSQVKVPESLSERKKANKQAVEAADAEKNSFFGRLKRMFGGGKKQDAERLKAKNQYSRDVVESTRGVREDSIE